VKRREFLKKVGVGSLAALGMPYLARAQARPVKMAVLLPLTGPFAFAGNAGREGFVDGADYVNEVLGGIAGRKLELIVEDTGYDVAKGTAAFNRVLSRERPDELLFVYGDSTGLSKALAPEIARLGLPYSATSFASELADPKTYPTIFVFGPTYNDMMEALLRQVRLQKGKARIALVYSNTEFGRDPIPYVKQRAKALGMEVVHEEVTPPAFTDATPVVLNLRRANPDFVLLQGYALSVEPLILRTAREQGLKAQFMGTYYGFCWGPSRPSPSATWSPSCPASPRPCPSWWCSLWSWRVLMAFSVSGRLRGCDAFRGEPQGGVPGRDPGPGRGFPGGAGRGGRGPFRPQRGGEEFLGAGHRRSPAQV
jgi:branched-chain amino acid transport system substrate-binding protein